MLLFTENSLSMYNNICANIVCLRTQVLDKFDGGPDLNMLSFLPDNRGRND